MRVIADQLEVLVDELEQGAHLRIELNARQRTRLPPELLVGLVEMVEIEVHVAEGVDELARNEPRHLRHHHGEQRVRGDVEGHTEEDIRRALIELAEELALRHIELEQAMARWERHLVELADVPGPPHVAAGIRVALQVFHDLRHLVDLAAVRRRPETPLPAIDWPEIAVFVRPLVPNCHAMLVEVTHIGRAFQEPEQFVDDRFHVQLLGGDERKTLRQVKAHLAAEQAQVTGSGAVPFPHAEVANLRKKVEILAQKPVLFRPPRVPRARQTLATDIGSGEPSIIPNLRRGTPLCVDSCGSFSSRFPAPCCPVRRAPSTSLSMTYATWPSTGASQPSRD